MADKRGNKNANDTGSPTARARDDLRTATKKDKPGDKRAEGRDQATKAKKGDNKKKSDTTKPKKNVNTNKKRQ